MLKFNKLLWLNRKTRITAENMNRIEDGISDAINEINNIDNELAGLSELTEQVNTNKSNISDLQNDAHTHDNKDLLDTYTQTEDDIADAIFNKHNHSNKAELDKISNGDVVKWNAIEQNAKDYADGLDEAMGTRVGTAEGKITTLEGKMSAAEGNITNLENSKQDSISFNTAYDKDTNKAATMIDISNSLSSYATKAEIPSKVSELSNDSGYITEEVDPTVPSWAKQANKPSYTASEVGALPNTTYIPQSGIDFLPPATIKAINDLTNYYTKSQTYTQSEINSLISAIPKFSIEVVTSLPTTDISLTTVYLVKSSEASGDLYTEYIYVNSDWEKLGTQTVDLSGYATKDWVSIQIQDFLTTDQVNTLISSALTNYRTASAQDTIDNNKVDKVDGKGLSTNDFTDAYKTKLEGIEAGAEKNLANTVIDADYVHTDNNYTTADKNKVASSYVKPSTGIPSSDLESSIQSSIGKANTAVQDNNYVHTDNNYTSEDKSKVAIAYQKPDSGIPITDLANTLTLEITTDTGTITYTICGVTANA